jgi:hypothetical protein
MMNTLQLYGRCRADPTGLTADCGSWRDRTCDRAIPRMGERDHQGSPHPHLAILISIEVGTSHIFDDLNFDATRTFASYTSSSATTPHTTARSQRKHRLPASHAFSYSSTNSNSPIPQHQEEPPVHPRSDRYEDGRRDRDCRPRCGR